MFMFIVDVDDGKAMSYNVLSINDVTNLRYPFLLVAAIPNTWLPTTSEPPPLRPQVLRDLCMFP